jgi:YVTN family beta-propeller protein
MLSTVTAQWLETTIVLPDSSVPLALCYNATDNRVYCAYISLDRDGDDVMVIDGATNSVLATVSAGYNPHALCYNSQNNKVYCANEASDNVTVIGGATNQVLQTIGVGRRPRDFTWNPVQNRVYVANYGGSSISVLRDSAVGIEEGPKPQASSSKPAATVVRGVLFLSGDCPRTGTVPSVLLDASGRKVMLFRPGPNDVSRLAPGVYFVREAQAQAQAVRKVVIQR